jgi:hypothetical protein
MARRSESSSQPDFSQHNLNEADLQKMISDAVFYVLVADQKKSLIKRPDLLKACDLAKKPKPVQDHVINAVISQLGAIFGIQMQELENRQNIG